MTNLEKVRTLVRSAFAAFASNDYPTTERLLQQALRLAPNRVSILTNLAAVLLKLGRPDEAKGYADRSVELDPENAEGWLNAGGALHDLKRYDEALASYDRALALNPAYAEAWSNRGNALSELKRHDEALASYGRTLALRPDYAEAWYNRGNTLNELKRHDEALASYDRALALKPGYAEAWYNRGNVLKELKRHDEALASYDRALALNPAYAEAWSNRGIALSELKRHDEALASYDRALALKTDYAETWSNRGNTLLHLKHHDEALTSFGRATRLDPGYAQAHFNESICRLSLGDFARGWEQYKWRWDTGRYGHKPPIDAPLWDGKQLQGTMLAWGEQGLGDQILHMGMLNQARALVGQLILAVEPRLMALAQRSFPGITVCSKNEPLPDQNLSAWIPMGDLGSHLRRSWQDFPQDPSPYLLADPERSGDLRRKLTRQHKFVCGLSWVSKNARFGDHKSIRLQDLLEILRIPGIEFVDLQYGDTRAEREAVQAAAGVTLTRLEEIDNTHDIDGLAALIRACDAVVTISNTTAHLAGALGTPLYLMLPRSLGRIWYWHEDRDDSPWYPGARLFRQPQPDDWGTIIRDVAREIRNQVTPSLP